MRPDRRLAAVQLGLFRTGQLFGAAPPLLEEKKGARAKKPRHQKAAQCERGLNHDNYVSKSMMNTFDNNFNIKIIMKSWKRILECKPNYYCAN